MDNIIKFPKGNDRNPELEDILKEREQQKILYADEIVENMSANILSLFLSSGTSVYDDTFLACFGYLTTTVQCCVYQSMGLDHPYISLIQDIDRKADRQSNTMSFIEPTYEDEHIIGKVNKNKIDDEIDD